MSEHARPVDTLEPPPKYEAELTECERICAELEEAERELRAGNPIAARMHLMDVSAKARALALGESI